MGHPIIYPFRQSGTAGIGIGIMVMMMIDTYNSRKNDKDFMMRLEADKKKVDDLYRRHTQLPPS
jgi:hypothetical protein